MGDSLSRGAYMEDKQSKWSWGWHTSCCSWPSWDQVAMGTQCLQEGRAQHDMLVGWVQSPVSMKHPCHRLILACPSSEHGRGRREDACVPQSWGIASSPWGGCCRYRHQSSLGHALPEQPDTYINLAEDNINDAADHYEEVEDIPGIPEVALPGKSRPML